MIVKPKPKQLKSYYVAITHTFPCCILFRFTLDAAEWLPRPIRGIKVQQLISCSVYSIGYYALVIEPFSSSQWRTQRQRSSIASTSEIPQPPVLPMPSLGFIPVNRSKDKLHLSRLASIITGCLPKTRILANGHAVELNRRKVLASRECQSAQRMA
jgi:hypothetical protein